MIFFAYAMAWVSTAGLAGYAVHVSGSLGPLWLMVLPACISLTRAKD